MKGKAPKRDQDRIAFIMAKDKLGYVADEEIRTVTEELGPSFSDLGLDPKKTYGLAEIYAAVQQMYRTEDVLSAMDEYDEFNGCSEEQKAEFAKKCSEKLQEVLCWNTSYADSYNQQIEAIIEEELKERK